MAHFRALMTASGTPDHGALLRERMGFARCFAAHGAQEERELVRMARNDASMCDRLRAYRERLGALRADYSAHINRWTPAAIQADRPGYRGAVTRLQDRLHAQMDWEERLVPIAAAI